METKICIKCEQTLSLLNFYKKGGSQLGYRGKCKKCLEKDNKLWKKCNPKKVQGYATNYQKANPEKARAWNNKATNAWKSKNKDKRIAQHKISNGIRDGKLVRQNCCVCKKIYNLEIKGQAHHSDYNKPLDITWLCHKHHRAWHRVFIAEQVNG